MDSHQPESTPERNPSAPPPQVHPDQRELQQLLSSSRPGITERRHLGKDGVLRTFTVDSEVVNAIPLPTRLIKALLDRTPYNGELENMMKGVDGTAVPREEWFHPDSSMLPVPLTEEEKEAARRYHEEKATRSERGNSGETPSCQATVKSDYNLGPGKADGEK